MQSAIGARFSATQLGALPPTPVIKKTHSGRVVVRCTSSQDSECSSAPADFALTRRQAGIALIGGLMASQELVLPEPAQAIQGLTAGRIPGLSTTADDEGYFTYTRPEGKSGGHGIGWSEVPRYSFKVPDGWQETPVSIADLGGTEIDLRYTSSAQGNIAVVVAPIMRFADISFNANMTIEKLGDPEKIIRGFAPELYGVPLDDDDILDMDVHKNGPLTYYYYKLKKDRLVTATAVKNRLFILTITCTARQAKKFGDQLLHIRDSFYVENEVVKNL